MCFVKTSAVHGDRPNRVGEARGQKVGRGAAEDAAGGDASGGEGGGRRGGGRHQAASDVREFISEVADALLFVERRLDESKLCFLRKESITNLHFVSQIVHIRFF